VYFDRPIGIYRFTIGMREGGYDDFVSPPR
jgi:hypothetical protein